MSSPEETMGEELAITWRQRPCGEGHQPGPFARETQPACVKSAGSQGSQHLYLHLPLPIGWTHPEAKEQRGPVQGSTGHSDQPFGAEQGGREQSGDPRS